ncbi:MAG: hypothetical protein ACRD0M_07975, partial [Acidimicrobiales bacterium]
ANTPVTVPGAGDGDLVFARLRLPDPSLLGAARRVLYKPARPPEIVLDGNRFTLVESTAGGPLVLRLPTGYALGPPGAVPPAATSLAVEHGGARLRVEFYRVAVAAVAATPAPAPPAP